MTHPAKRTDQDEALAAMAFEGGTYDLLPADTPMPDENAHYQLTTVSGQTLHETCDPDDATEWLVIFTRLLGEVLLLARRERMCWCWALDTDGIRHVFCVRGRDE